MYFPVFLACVLSIRLYKKKMFFWYDVIRIINIFRRTILIQLLSFNIVVWHIISNDIDDDYGDNGDNENNTIKKRNNNNIDTKDTIIK